MTQSPPTEAKGRSADALPPVAPQIVAAAVADLTSRLAKKLDATIERLASVPITVADDGIHLDCGSDAVVSLTPGDTGVIITADQARCSCLLAPRCLHRAAVLSACPVADLAAEPEPPAPDSSLPASTAGGTAQPAATDGTAPDRTGRGSGPDRTGRGSGPDRTGRGSGPDRTGRGSGPTAAQRRAANGLWQAASAVLSAGVPGAGAVPQAELLLAAHSARLAGLHRAESAALRVARGLRAARARHNTHRLADLVQALHELLLTTGRLGTGDSDPALLGVARRAYQPGGSLRVYGVCREPVISATGYAGVVTHVVADDGRWFSVADVRPGGPDRARAAATAAVEMGTAAINHARLARGGLLLTGATISPDGRLGAGRGVRATPVDGDIWSADPPAPLFAHGLAARVRAELSRTAGDGQDDTPQSDDGLVGGDLVVVGAVGDHVLARELPAEPGEPGGPLIRLVPANSHPDLAHLVNLRRLASRPGLRIRLVGRLDPDRAGTLRPLAVGPVPGAESTLRLPEEWRGHADLGYDQLQGSHLPPLASVAVPVAEAGPDPVTTSPLWRVRRLVELAVAGGRRAVGESARSGDSGLAAPLRQAGFHAAAGLAAALAAESDRQGRDVFGRLTQPDPDRYAWAWVAATTHLAATERELVQASWTDLPPG